MEYTASAITGIICCTIGALLLPLLPLLSWLKEQGHLASFLEWRKGGMSDPLLVKYFHNHRESRLWKCPACGHINAPSEYSFETWPRNITEIEWAACNCGREFNLRWNWRTMRLDVGEQRPRANDLDGFIPEHPHSDAASGEVIRLETTELMANWNPPAGFVPSERSGEGIAETQGMSLTFVQHWEEPKEEEFNIQKDWTCAECNTVHPLSKIEQEQIIGQLKIAKRARLTKQCPSCDTKVHIRIEEIEKIDGIMDASGVSSFAFYCGNCKTECEYKIYRAELVGIDRRSIDYHCRKCGAKLGIALQRPRPDVNEWIVKVLWCHSPRQEFERRINEGAKRKVKF